MVVNTFATTAKTQLLLHVPQSLTFRNCTFCHVVYLCDFYDFGTVTILILIAMQPVYCAVQTAFLNIVHFHFAIKGLRNACPA